jgi:hypothetical protein
MRVLLFNAMIAIYALVYLIGEMNIRKGRR